MEWPYSETEQEVRVPASNGWESISGASSRVRYDTRKNSLQITIHVHFRQQRFKSRPVPCSCEPDIEEGFLLELSKHSSSHPDYDNDRMVTPNDALSITDSTCSTNENKLQDQVVKLI